MPPHMVNIHEAKTHFSKLVQAVIQGKEILIAIAGKPVAKLTRIQQKPSRRLGWMKGKIKIAKGFDDPLPEDLLAAFNGELE